jgi:hypothetical protein
MSISTETRTQGATNQKHQTLGGTPYKAWVAKAAKQPMIERPESEASNQRDPTAHALVGSRERLGAGAWFSCNRFSLG